MPASNPDWTRQGRIGDDYIELHKQSSTDFILTLENFLEWCDIDVPDIHEVVGPTKNYNRLRRRTAAALLLMLAEDGYKNAQALVKTYNLRVENDGNITPLPIERAVKPADGKKYSKDYSYERTILAWVPIPDGRVPLRCDNPYHETTPRVSPHPDGGGVYVFRATEEGEVLYVGQTRNYKNRLNSAHSYLVYCTENYHDLHITYHPETCRVERLFLECQLIAELRPSLQFVRGPWTSPNPPKGTF